MCIVAEDEGVPAGMIVLKVFGPEMEHEELRLPDCPERDLVLSCDRIAFIDALAVSSDHQGRGIGTVLCDRALEIARDRGCDIICAMASKYVTGVTNADGVFRRMGMTAGIELKGYWDMLVPGISCRYCEGPCRCSGVFWHLSLRPARSASRRCQRRPLRFRLRSGSRASCPDTASSRV